MTKSSSETAEITRANFGFNALVFAIFWLDELEVVLLTTVAGIGAHLISFALLIILSTIAYRRCRARWAPERNLTLPRGSTPGEIASGLALVAAGCTFAYSMRTGFVTPAVICAAVLCLLTHPDERADSFTGRGKAGSEPVQLMQKRSPMAREGGVKIRRGRAAPFSQASRWCG